MLPTNIQRNHPWSWKHTCRKWQPIRLGSTWSTCANPAKTHTVYDELASFSGWESHKWDVNKAANKNCWLHLPRLHFLSFPLGNDNLHSFYRTNCGFSENKTKQTIPDAQEAPRFGLSYISVSEAVCTTGRTTLAPKGWWLRINTSKGSPKYVLLKIGSLGTSLKIVNNCQFGDNFGHHVSVFQGLKALRAIFINTGPNSEASPAAHLLFMESSLDTCWGRRTNP